MKAGRICFWGSLHIVSLALLADLPAHAASGSWLGGTDAYWTNGLNWSASPFPSGADTATFNGASANTTVDIAGLTNIVNITFDTASAAAYTIGAGAANSQTNILRNGGEIKLTGTAGNSQTFNSTVRLGPDATDASYSLRNDNPGQTLTFSDIAGMSGGTKTLNINGTGPIVVNGKLDRTGSALDLYYNSTNSLALNGNTSVRLVQINATNGVINLGAGTILNVSNAGGNGLMAAQDSTINGPGVITLSTVGNNNHLDNGAANGKTLTINAKITGATGFEFWHASYIGTIALLNADNDYTQSTIINVPGTIAFNSLANGLSPCSLGAGTNIILNSGSGRYLYTGSGDTSDRLVDLQAGGIIEQAGTGNLKFTTPTGATGGGKTLTLQGSTAGTGEFSGGILNGAGTVSVTKYGTGTWTISGNSTYSGATLVSGGTLAVSGASGSLAASTGYTLTNGATLLLSNSSAANNTNRLRDASAITLNGGTLSLFNDGSAANYSENAGALAVNLNASTVSATQAPEGQTSTLRFASLSRANSATVNFSGTGIGESDRNRIFITAQTDGLIGPWATVNGTSLAAYSSAKGVYAADGASAEVAAEGGVPESVITNDATATARISLPGLSGPITVQGELTNSILLVKQCTTTNTTIALRDGSTNKTFLAGGLTIEAGKASLTLGAAEGDGYLAPLSSGGTVALQNDDSVSLLTVNAPLINNTAASSLAKYGTGKALLTASNSYSGATAIYEGTLAFGGSATQTLAGVISGNGVLAKEGTGLLVLPVANSYTGLTTIAGGTVLVKNNAALGGTTAGTVISGGGTLDIGGSASAEAMDLNAEQITVSGAGVNGRGAIINGSSVSQYKALRLVTLAGDTTFGGELGSARWDIRNASGTATLTMNGYTVTKVGTNMVGLTNVGVTPGATGAIDVQQGTFTIEDYTTMGGTAANTLTVRSGAVFDIYALRAPVAWSLVMEDNTRFYARSGNATNLSIWAGPATLNGRAVFDAYGTFSDTISGPISGTGSVVKTTANSTTYFRNTNNTYTGTTIISNGTLYAQHPGSLPGYNDGRLTVVANGTLAAHAYDGNIGWTAENIRDLNAASSFLAETAWFSLDTTLASLTMPYDITNRMGIIKLGTNTLTLTGTQRNRGDYRIYAGELAFNAPGNHEIGMLLTLNASVVMTNSSQTYINVTNKSCYISDSAGNSSTWLVGGKTVWSAYLPGRNVGQGTLYIGQRGKAVLTLKDEAVITNRFLLGNEATSAGALYQSGNTIYHNWGGEASDSKIGIAGYGYYELNGGTLTNNGYTQVGCNYTGVGILKQTGGAFKMGNVYGGQLAISRGGTGVIHTVGGTFRTVNQLNIGESSDYGLIRGFGDFTVDDSADVYIAGNIYMADRTNMFATVNLNGGTTTANQFSKSSSRTGSTALVNFGGGTFCARAAGNLFNTGANAPDAVTLYNGGATFDTTNLICAIPVPLRAPVGGGVASIAITPRGGYIGPPFVTISGDGTGATAVAQFDSASGFVNGITVTCPGSGYTTAAVSLSGGGTNIHNAAVASLAPNVGGGLTKVGSGTLTLSATNTYAGATTVSNGTLKISVAEALPTGTDINIDGGLLDLGGFTVTNGAVTASAGGIANGALVSDSFTKVGPSSMTLAVPVSSADPILIESGTLRLQGSLPGLLEGPVAGAFNVTDPMTTSIVARLTTRMANIVYYEPYNTTWIYKGYIWNRATTNVTWTFAENFDDNVKLTIDSTVMMTNGITWNVPTLSTITLAPGPHPFEARFGQGGGGGGPVNGNTTTPKSWWTTTAFGFGIDTLGRNDTNIANYVAMTDPGDGTLLTTSAYAENPLSVDSEIIVSAGATLDLDGNTQTLTGLSGSGMVTNGTLTVSGTAAPGGEGTVGDLTLACDTTLTGNLLVDVSATDNDTLIVSGDLALGGTSTLTVANPGALEASKVYTIAIPANGGQITGTIAWTNPPNNQWFARITSDGKLSLFYVGGTLIQIK